MFGNSKIITLMAFTFLFAFTACDDNDDVPEPDEAYFSMEVSGDMELELDGQVFYADYFDPEFSEDIFLLNMLPKTEQSANLMFIMRGGRPGTGSYPIVLHDEYEAGGFLDDAFVSKFSLQMEEGEVPAMYFFEATDGNIGFEESSDEFVSGSFEYEATGGNVHDETSDKEVVISGTFSAPRANVEDIDP